MRFHVVSLPHTQTTRAYASCAYTQKIIKWCDMMTDGGHEVFLYSGDQNEARVAEHIALFTEKARSKRWGVGFDTVKSPLLWDASLPYWKTMNTRAKREIDKRAQVGDFLCLIAGWAQKPIADGLSLVQQREMLCVEWGVGYEGIFSEFCAFESYAWQHWVYGKERWALGRFYDTVIPNFFDRNDFKLAGCDYADGCPSCGKSKCACEDWRSYGKRTARENMREARQQRIDDNKEDYLLYVGRLIERKGVHVAALIADRLKMRLLVAGPGAAEWEDGRIIATDGTQIVTPGVRYVGEVGIAERAELMSKARALLAPTLYIEPFGGVTVEAMMSGTPVVTTDFGAFTETVTSDVGRRFRTLSEGVEATKETFGLDPVAVRDSALDRFSLEAVRPRYERWFTQMLGLWGPGWDA